MSQIEPHDEPPADGAMPRTLNLTQAIALNVANMVGIGPFITIPLFLSAMKGPHALVAWGIAAILVICDGLVWSELGAALPGSGGTYHFLKEIFGPLNRFWGQLMPFLFIWQFLISGTLEMASGYLGTVQYLGYIFPILKSPPGGEVWARVPAPLPGGHLLAWMPDRTNLIAASAALAVTVLLCRRIEILGRMGVWLCAGTILAAATVIVSGAAHFDPKLLAFPERDFAWTDIAGMAVGLGGAMRIAIYDYLGYFNICHLGDEVRDPGRTIPRAVIRSILIVASIYFLMNVAIIGVVPWQKAMESKNVAADFMEQLYGRNIAVLFTCLVLWTVAAGMFSITLGYSRIPYAAARSGDFFSVFARLHPTGRYPVVSLVAVGCLTAVCCFFSLQTVIDAAVAVRILVQFIGQIVALHLMRTRRPDIVMPYRMRLYPLASLVALIGWIFVLGTSERDVLSWAIGITLTGLPVFFVWKRLVKRPTSTSNTVDRLS